jgi:cystathionine beta-synthase
MIGQIGNTPLLPLPSLSRRFGCQVSLKAEYLNPGMSSKDRPALYMVRQAEREGLLKPGYTVVEASSGNTAIGLALVCKELGYKCHFFLSDKSSHEKRAVLQLYGAEITICSSSGDMSDPHSTLGRACRFAENTPKTWFCNQYFNQANGQAHFETTGPEIWEQTQGSVTHFVVGVGTGGTISGVSRFLKSCNSRVQIVGVDPRGSVLFDYFYTGKPTTADSSKYNIEGIGRNFLPGALHIEHIDDFVQVSDSEAVEAAYRFIESDGFMPGFSTGAVLAAAEKIAGSLSADSHMVLFFADHGSRYMSKLYDVNWVEQVIGPKTMPPTTDSKSAAKGTIVVKETISDQYIPLDFEEARLIRQNGHPFAPTPPQHRSPVKINLPPRS